MGLTRAQAKSLGLGHLYPDARSDESIIRELAGERAPPPPKEPGDGMTKLERSFTEVLEIAKDNHDISGWRYEAIRLRLAGRCWFLPDFLTEPCWQEDKFTFIETKGPYAREDSLIKLKVAAETYPCFRWLLVTKSGRHGWDVRKVTRTGIGREPIEIPWISGGGG